MNQSVRVRFAPSPTGFLHVGNVRTALFNWLFCRQSGGCFILRIEDTDLERSAQSYETQILEDLHWLGLDWDEGVDVGGNYGSYRQTDRFPIYQSYAERLLREGSAYPCFCTPEELEKERQQQLERKQMPRYSGRCRVLPAQNAVRRRASGEPNVVRLRVREGDVRFDDLVFGPISVQSSAIGDFVLLRNDGSPVYNFCCVVDDIEMRITHVIRGEGHLSNTHRQVLIYETLKAPMPAFAHLSTILGNDGEKLSKRHGATSVLEFRKMGYLPEAMLNYLALLGWAPPGEGQELLSPQEIIERFSLARVNRNPAIFDAEKLNWVSRYHIRQASIERLVDLAIPFLLGEGLIDAAPDASVRSWLGEVVAAVRHNIDRLDQLAAQVEPLFAFAPEELGESEQREIHAHPEVRQVIEAFHEVARQRFIGSAEDYRATMMEVRNRTGAKGKKLFHPIRFAVTAAASGLELEALIPLLEKGSRLGLSIPVLSAAQRAERFLAHHFPR